MKRPSIQEVIRLIQADKVGCIVVKDSVGIPVFSDAGEIERYNVFRMELLIRHSHDGKLYLYDVVNIKKETSNPLEQ